MIQTYYLTCTECEYDRHVDGFEDALEVADGHSDGESGHYVDVFLVDDSDMTPDPTSLTGGSPPARSRAAGDDE